MFLSIVKLYVHIKRHASFLWRSMIIPIEKHIFFFFYFPSQVIRNTKIQFKEFNKKKSIQFQSSFSILFNFFLQYHSYKNIKIEDSVMAYSIYNKQYIRCTCKQTIYLLSCLYSIYCIKNWNLKEAVKKNVEKQVTHSRVYYYFFYILSFQWKQQQNNKNKIFRTNKN